MNPRAEASMSMPPPRQTRGRVLLFAARILPDQTRETAIFRLRELRRLYNSIYGETNTRCLYHIFANRRPNLPLDRRFYGPHSLGDGYFLKLLDIVKDSSLELEIVLHGWCAMTTDPLTFVGLFGHISHKTKLMIFDFILYTSRMKFYEPNVQELSNGFRLYVFFN